MFCALYAAKGSSPAALIDVARGFSPRVGTMPGDREVVLDLSGLMRLFGSPRALAEQLRRTAADAGLQVRVALAGTQTAARLLVRHRAGVTVIEPGTEAEALASLPLETLTGLLTPPSGHLNVPKAPNPPSRAAHQARYGAASDPNDLITLSHWGVRTLGALAALPADDLAARLGQAGVRWQRAARGEDAGPLVPGVPDERFEQALDLEWPIEGLEPLSFVLGRLLEPLSAHLERRDRGAAVLHVRLHLITRVVHERSLQLPIPMREARTLRTLILLDLESHPPPAAIDRVVVAVDPTPARIVHGSLFARPLPAPEQVATLMARLHALMGETRCGAPATTDSWEPGAFAVRPFMPVGRGAEDSTTPRHRGTEVLRSQRHRGTEAPRIHMTHGATDSPTSQKQEPIHDPLCLGASVSCLALRRFRLPIVARVRIEHGRPLHVSTDRRELPGGGVVTCAGPWRTSGAWWLDARDGEPRSDLRAWDREEWDVTLADEGTYRMFRDRRSDRWFIEGMVD